jgi:hypothetical protein
MNEAFTSYAAVLVMPAGQVVQQRTIRRTRPATSAREEPATSAREEPPAGWTSRPARLMNFGAGQVRGVKDFAESDWAHEWNAIRTVSDRSGGAIRVPGRPWHFADQVPADDDQLVAHQGEHNTEVLNDLGFSASEIRALEADGALIQPGRNRACHRLALSGYRKAAGSHDTQAWGRPTAITVVPLRGVSGAARPGPRWCGR